MSPVQGRRAVTLASVAYWAIPSLLCLALHWRGFTAWFRGDDFAWLGTGIYIQNFHDFVVAIFAPQAQGTIRPLSERLFFLVGFSLFGLDALPFKVVVFVTQFANLALVAWIGARLTGLRWAGFFAAIFWVLNASAILPLGWVWACTTRCFAGSSPFAGFAAFAGVFGERGAQIFVVAVGGFFCWGLGLWNSMCGCDLGGLQAA